MVVGENPKTLHQPLTWANRKGNTEPAPPTPLENPYMGVKDYDTWSNQCENEFLKDMDEYKVDPTTKPFPVVKQVEWATLFMNSHWPVQYTEQCPPECKPDIYTWDHVSIARHWDKYASLDMILSSDGVKLTNAYHKQLEDFVLRNREQYRQWCLAASNLGIQVSLATLIMPVKPQSLGESPFSVHLLSHSMPDELAMTQLSLRNIVGDGPFLPPSHYASSSAAHFSQGVTCDLDEALEAEPWFGPDNDEEEAAQEEEDALD
ncbi:hypothetical protein BS47DRAFT_1395061 [Hydnum rufescens UP504]|uniref:Uncharacterized protein n=1 Tax=Hydnum rufescens UP504 TaxID=1448309 RepID=A0A9P6DQS9_9AGAM|nr:hypothetical protein BS47DRAFT_1395061 [Hydnum rufescens UP504]